MKAHVLVLASIFFAPVAGSSQGNPSQPQVEKIKILSWNIYMLPGFLGIGNQPRSEAIGSLLAASDYDVIVFQEAFNKRARKNISRHLLPAFPFQSGPANRKRIALKTNSGIWIVSRYPILAEHSIVFKTRHGIDALSRKGALLIELKVNNSIVQVVGTHLQNSGNDWLRQSQCVELYYRLLRPHERPGVPQFLCGDFNINRYEADDDNYQLMLKTLDAIDTDTNKDEHYTYDRASNDLRVESGSRRDLIDYLLVRPNDGVVHCNPKVSIRQQRWHRRYQDLSDHYALEADINFQSSPPLYIVSIPK